MSGLRGRPAIALVARREITQRIREKSFLISMAVTVVLVVLVAVVPPLFGFGGKETFTVAVADDASLAVAKAADRGAKAFDADLKVRRLSAEDPNAGADGRQGRRRAVDARAPRAGGARPDPGRDPRDRPPRGAAGPGAASARG